MAITNGNSVIFDEKHSLRMDWLQCKVQWSSVTVRFTWITHKIFHLSEHQRINEK